MRSWIFALSLVAGLLALTTPGFGADPLDFNAALRYAKSDNPKDRAFAMVTMDYLGPDAAAGSKVVVGAMFDSSAEVRQIAYKAIAKVDPTIAGPVQALAGAQNYDAKLAALQKLSDLGSAGAAALPALSNFLANARPEDRVSIVNSIASVGAKDPDAAKFLATVALNDPDASLRKDAMAKLGKMESGPSATAIFVQALTNGTTDTQKLAIQGLGAVGKNNPDAIQALNAAVALAKDPKIRDAAKDALKQAK